MSHFIHLTSIMTQQPHMGFMERPICIEAATIILLAPDTLTLPGLPNLGVTHVHAVKGGMLFAYYVKETMDFVESAVEKALLPIVPKLELKQ